MVLDACVALFQGFTSEYLSGDADADELYLLKISHTMNVLRNASAIIEGERITGKTAQLCQLSALFHDIGRFPQLKQYNTFRDRESVNHGRLGVQTLRDLELPTTLSDREWRTVRIAVGQHNLKTVSPGLPSRLATPVHLVRDADKIDILRVIIDHFGNREDRNPLVTHGVADEPDKYSELILNQILSGLPGDYADIKYANDFILIALGWTFSFHFRTTLSLAVERGYIERTLALLPKDNTIRKLNQKCHTLMHYN